jgi:hypothetical protein
MGADVAPLEAVRVLECWRLVGHLPGGGVIAGSGCTQVERLVRARAVERLAEASELERLSPPRAGWRAGGCRRQGAMQALMAPVLLGVSGSMHAGKIPRRTHQAASGERLPRVWVAQGTPVSVRRRVGQPNSLKRRVNTGLASATRVEESA